MDPVDISLLGLPGVAWLWVLTAIAYGVFGRRAFHLVRGLRQGRQEIRWDQPWRRLKHALYHVLLQPRIFNERSIGWAHFVTFWGFVVYATCFQWNLVRGLFPGLPIPYSDEVGLVAIFLEVFAVLVLLGVGAGILRRLYYPPPHLHLSRDASFILGLIAALMLSTLFGQGFRILAEGPEAAASASLLGPPLAWLFGQSSALTSAAEAWAHGMWWAHMVIVLFFFVYLPYSKHGHLLVAPFNVFFSSQRSPGDLTLVGAPEEIKEGSADWREFTWKQLLAGLSCAECGRCDRACPALAAGYSISPQQVIQRLKERMLARMNGEPVWRGSNGDGRLAFVGDVIPEAEIWACTTCLSCMEHCAVWNEQVPIFVQMRRHLVGQGSVDGSVQEALAKITRYGNSFGKSERLRAQWVKKLGIKVKDARREPVEYLWFLGDYAAFDPSVAASTKATARIFEQAGLDFGILFEGERNSGNDVRRIGEEGLYEMLREKNLMALEKAKYRTVVTTDPHSYNTLKNEYGLGSNGEVMHYTELLEQFLEEGTLSLSRKLSGRVTYHDPCYLGRYNGVYEPARHVLQSLGLELVEMPRNRGRSHCCGAGGGRIWMEDTPGIKERPSESRIREAVALPDVSCLVVCCPKDISMFRDAVKTTGNEGRIEVKDIADLVWEAVGQEKVNQQTETL